MEEKKTILLDIWILSEFLFKRAYDYAERIETFFDIIAKMYPPMSTFIDQPVATDEEPSTSKH